MFEIINLKKLWASVVPAVICLGAVTSHATEYLLGDVDMDGVITVDDSLQVARKSVGLDVSWFPETWADVNCDDIVDIEDALVIAQYAEGYINEMLCNRTELEALTIEANRNVDRVLDYYLDRFNWSGLDGAGTGVYININVGDENNAKMNMSTLSIGEADGVRSLSWAYSEDMIAHEVTHGVIAYTANLTVSEVNESFADVMAVFATAKDGVADWKLGEHVWTPEIDGDALRHVDVPNHGYDRDSLGSCWFDARYPVACGQAQHLRDYASFSEGEHVNQGILNRAAFLLVEGGVNEGIEVNGIGVPKAEQIYFNTIINHLSLSATLTEARIALLTSCDELLGEFGITEADCQSISDAFDSVGLVAPPMDAPLGISGRIFDGGLPAAGVTLSLRANHANKGTVHGGWSNAIIAETQTGADGFYHFTPAMIEEGLQFVPDSAKNFLNYQVVYLNSDVTDTAHLQKWDTRAIRTIYNPARTIDSFDIAAFTPVSVTGSVQAPPVEFGWTHPSDGYRYYYTWNGCGETNEYGYANCLTDDSLSKMVDNAIFIDADFAAEISANSSALSFSDITQWRLLASSYTGWGETNLFQIDN